MKFCIGNALWAMAPPPGGQAEDPKAAMLKMLGTMAFFFVVLYLLMIRPQKKKAQQHAELLKSVKKGDRIVTSGGIVGVVVGLKEKSLSIRSDDTKLEIMRSAVAEITEKAANGGES